MGVHPPGNWPRLWPHLHIYIIRTRSNPSSPRPDLETFECRRLRDPAAFCGLPFAGNSTAARALRLTAGGSGADGGGEVRANLVQNVHRDRDLVR